MSTHTLSWIIPPGQPDQHGVRYVNLGLDEDKAAYIGGKGDHAEEHFQRLSALEGEEIEVTLEETGRVTKSGLPKFKLLTYPGFDPENNVYDKPPVRSMADGGWKQAQAQDAKDVHAELAALDVWPGSNMSTDESIGRWAALKCAAMTGGGSLEPDEVIALAERYIKWHDKAHEAE